jgi:AraC family transcriptional regulator of adaptative response / DNA-3-methyladenine glycosylase II
MELDPERCYQAIKARDARFDGRFFTGVVTTGIYCRPVCPAPTPKAKNVRFFASAAAAEAAGHRPCLRCRPETSPGTPAWAGSSATVSRALRAIADGVLEDEGIDGLAERLGVGARQLRRLFQEHLGASPLAVAKARRAHFARSLLDQTDMSIADVAFSSGFGSVRQFNDSIRATFGWTPTELRKRARRSRKPEGPGMTLRLAYRPPLDHASLLGFLAGRAIPGVEAVDAVSYARTVEVDGRPGVIEMRPEPDKNHVLLHLELAGYDALIDVAERARRIFDLGADPAAITRQLQNDPIIGTSVEARPGLRVPGCWDPFEVVVRAILGQQISVAAATTLAGRVVDTFGKPVEGHEVRGLTHLFPTPEILAEADLSSLGMTGSQERAIGAVAHAIASGALDLNSSTGLDDLVGRLCELPGIGEWTAHYVAMRALGEPDAFPASDLGLRKAASDNGTPISAARLERAAEDWRPWRAYAAMHLWASLPAPPSKRRKT